MQLGHLYKDCECEFSVAALGGRRTRQHWPYDEAVARSTILSVCDRVLLLVSATGQWTHSALYGPTVILPASSVISTAGGQYRVLRRSPPHKNFYRSLITYLSHCLFSIRSSGFLLAPGIAADTTQPSRSGRRQ